MVTEAFESAIRENPVSPGEKILVGLAVVGGVGLLAYALWPKKAAASGGGSSGSPGSNSKTINVSFQNAVPGNQQPITAAVGDTIVFALPAPPGQALSGNGQWVDASAGGVKFQTQGPGGAGVPWQMTYTVTGPGTLGVSNRTPAGMIAEWYAVAVKIG